MFCSWPCLGSHTASVGQGAGRAGGLLDPHRSRALHEAAWCSYSRVAGDRGEREAWHLRDLKLHPGRKERVREQGTPLWSSECWSAALVRHSRAPSGQAASLCITSSEADLWVQWPTC